MLSLTLLFCPLLVCLDFSFAYTVILLYCPSFYVVCVCVCVPVSLMTRSATFSLPDTSGCSLSLTYSKNLPLSRATGGHVVSLYSALPFGHVAVCAAAHVAVCAALGGWRCWALSWS